MSKNEAAAEMGRKGGKRSLETMTPEQRHARAKKAGLVNAKRLRAKKKNAPKP